MKRGLFLLAMCLLGFACRNTPSGLIPRDQMAEVLWDMVQADQFATQYILRDSAKLKKIKPETFELYQKVFRLHHISKDQFVDSYNYYLDHPDVMKTIVDSLNASASRRRQEMFKSFN